MRQRINPWATSNYDAIGNKAIQITYSWAFTPLCIRERAFSDRQKNARFLGGFYMS